MKKCCDKRMIWVSMLLLFLCFLPIASALEKDPLKDMDLNFLTEETGRIPKKWAKCILFDDIG